MGSYVICIECTYGGTDSLEHRDHVRRVLWHTTTLACHYEGGFYRHFLSFVTDSGPSRTRIFPVAGDAQSVKGKTNAAWYVHVYSVEPVGHHEATATSNCQLQL